jgi:hypothetical protein
MKAMKDILAKRGGTVALSLEASAGHIAIADEAGASIRDGSELPGCSLEATDTTAFREAIRVWVRAARAEGMRCRVAMGASFFRVDTATLPSMSESELASSARFEALDRFGLEASEAVIQHLVTGETAGGREVALFAAPLAQVRRLAEIVMEAGLLPESVEHAAVTAARGAMRSERGMSADLVASMHVEPTVATLTLWRAGRLAAIRSIAGDWKSQPQVESHVSVEDPDAIPLEPVATCGWRWSALAEETLRSLRRACSDTEWPACLAVSGLAARDADLVRAVGGVCGLPTVAADCGSWVHATSCRLDPSWAPMLGVATPVAAESNIRKAA